jgi:hypothetical protein
MLEYHEDKAANGDHNNYYLEEKKNIDKTTYKFGIQVPKDSRALSI